MAKTKTSWKPGLCPNPKGRPLNDVRLKEGRELLKIKFESILHDFLKMTQGELHSVHCSPKATAIELLMARFIQRAINEGDVARFSLLCDRILGKQKESSELSGPNGQPLIPDIRQYSPDTLTAILIKLKKEAEAVECQTSMSSRPSLLPLLPVSLPQVSDTES